VPPIPPCVRGFPSFPLVTTTLPTVYGIAAGDLDGDGKADLVFADNNNGAVVVMLDAPGGTFGAPRTYALPGASDAVAVADFDGDGKLDIVASADGASASANGTVHVLLGNGDGTFASPVPYTVGAQPRFIAIDDLDGDGKRDLVVSNFNSGSVSVLLGDVGGAFKPAVSYSVGVSGAAGARPYGIVIVDVDGDTKLDVVTANYGDGQIAVMKGVGDGTLTGLAKYTAGANTLAIATADLNNDGHPDLAVANFGGPNAGVFLNQGDGTFPLNQAGYMVGMSARAIAIADADGDGVLDLLVPNFGSNDALLLRGNGNGTFALATVAQTVPTPSAVATGDFNGDGKSDLVIVSRDSSEAHIVLARPTGLALPIVLPTLGQPMRSSTADLDGDGRPDLVIPFQSAPPGVGVYLNGVNGLQPFVQYGGGNAPWATALADLDGDGHLDLLVTDYYTAASQLITRLGNGSGAFATTASSIAVGVAPTAVVTGDLDHDGVLDALTVDPAATPPAFTMLQGLGNGKFTSRGSPQAPGGPPYDAALVDLDGDGWLDLVITSNSGTYGVWVRMGTGPFAFAPAMPYSTLGSAALMLATGDFNGDGKIDLAVGNTTSSSVGILLGNGDGTFTPLAAYPVGDTPWEVNAFDIDGDGNLDVIATGSGRGTVSVMLGVGDGSLRAPRLFIAGAYATGLSIADFDGDGVPDFAVSNRAANSGSLLVSHCVD